MPWLAKASRSTGKPSPAPVDDLIAMTGQPEEKLRSVPDPRTFFSRVINGSRLIRAIVAVSVFTVAAGLVARTWQLDRLPGINGDESWYGCNAFRFIHLLPIWWHTPVGNRINPFYQGLIFYEHAVLRMAPSFLALRIPAAVAGILTVGLTYPLLRRVLPPRVAWVTLILVASSPVLIVYSRIGWDSCQTPLIGMLVLWAAFSARWMLLVGCFGIAVVVHPTNVYLAPIAVAIAASHFGAALGRSGAKERGELILRGSLVFLITVAATAAAVRAWGSNWPRPDMAEIWSRLTSLAGWREAADLFPKLITGLTAIRFTAGAIDHGIMVEHTAALKVGLVLLVVYASIRLIQLRRWPEVSLLAGISLSFVALYLTAGPNPFRFNWDRYALFLVVPGILAFACLLEVSITSTSRLLGVVVVCACAQFLTVGEHYFRRLAQTGGNDGPAFRTSVREPKASVVDAITRNVPGRVTIFAEDWWCYMPIHYLMEANSRVAVEMVEGSPEAHLAQMAPESGRRYFAVGFSSGIYSKFLAGSTPVGEVNDPQGKPILFYWEIAPPTSEHSARG
jgi:hypothetical protein